jgi:hypothetical protein
MDVRYWMLDARCSLLSTGGIVALSGDEGKGRRQEAGGRKQEAGGRRQEAGGRRQEVGGRRQEAGSRRRGPRIDEQIRSKYSRVVETAWYGV